MVIKRIVDYSDDILEEARRLENEGMEYKRAFRQALTMYASYCDDQSTSNDSENINEIIPPGADLDNDEVYDKKSSETIKDL